MSGIKVLCVPTQNLTFIRFRVYLNYMSIIETLLGRIEYPATTYNIKTFLNNFTVTFRGLTLFIYLFIQIQTKIIKHNALF